MSTKKKRMNTNAKWLLALFVEIVILGIMVVGYVVFWVGTKYDKLQILDIDKEDLAINEGANEEQKGYTTIALFGIDARDNVNLGAGNRSDTIMIASINNDTKEIKLVSVYRDSLLEIQDGSGLTTKINAAYAYGGPELAIKTLNACLDLQITEFVTVNWLALTKAIDCLGGVTIHIEEDEIQVLNQYIAGQVTVTGIYSDGVFATGNQLLNGTQATAYARIRSTDRGDITRTERQRDVLTKMINKAKGTDLSTIEDIIDEVFPNVYTSITQDEMYGYVKGIFSYKLGETAGFPFAYMPVNHSYKGSILVPANLEANVSALHLFLFGTKDYEPTQTVKDISAKLEAETGVYEQEINIDTYTAE